MLTLTLALAAAVSPLGVHVYTSDGAMQLVGVADADAEPVEVCARDVDVDAAADDVCAPVVIEGDVLVARLDRVSSPAMRLSLKSMHPAWRGSTPAVIAVGLGGISAVCVVGAVTLGVAATTMAGGVDVATAIDAGGARGTTLAAVEGAGILMWVGGAVSAVAAVGVGVIAVLDAQVVE